MDDYVAATGHSFGEWYETKAPTCTEGGTDERECSVCHHKETRATDAKGHTADEATTENEVKATCTAGGSYESVVYCSVCNEELSRESKTIDKLGHDYSTEWTVDVKPTCTTPGSKSHHCSRCEAKAEVTEIDAIEHQYDHKVTPPTCTEQGYTTHTCANCEDSYVDSYVNAFGHTYDNDADSTCNVCGEVRQIATEQTTAQTTVTSDSDEKASGCGSSISSGSVLMILLIGCVACVSVKKKKQ